MVRSRYPLLLIPLLVAACSDLEPEGPAGSVNVAPAVVVRGQYSPDQVTCRNDGGDLMIVQDLSTLIFRGGFDYQPASPDEFDGYIDDSGDVVFEITEGAVSLTCNASFVDDLLTGICTGTESCNFIFKKKSE